MPPAAAGLRGSGWTQEAVAREAAAAAREAAAAAKEVTTTTIEVWV